ncbi:MAG: lamin tail domain-containing protein, partial [Patescibacteria group bacterium]
MTVKSKIIYLILAVFMLMGFDSALAYDDKTTHPALTDEIVNFYNLSFPDKPLTPQQKEWIVEGSILEDTPPRWINHFYDPVYQEGWNGEHTGKYDAETVRLVSEKLIAPYGITPVSSLEWLHNEQLQSQYGFYKGDKTWERGILEMVKGNEEESYRILGYILHLLEDQSVPEHTRNDTHAHELEGATGDYGSPYEEYLKKYDRQNVKKELDISNKLKRENLYPPKKSTIDDYLISLAGYSNRYFFSKDTINDPKYSEPKIIRDDGDFGYGMDEGGREFILVKATVFKTQKGTTTIFDLSKNDTNILDAYFSRLSRQAVLHGAGVVELFLNKAAEEKEYPSHAVIYDFSPFNNFELPKISLTGELARIGNAALTLVNRAGSAVNAAVDSAKAAFSRLFSQDNFRPAENVPLGGQLSSVIPAPNRPAEDPTSPPQEKRASGNDETPENRPSAGNNAPLSLPAPVSSAKPENPLPQAEPPAVKKAELPAKPLPPKTVSSSPVPVSQPPAPPPRCSFNSAQSSASPSVIISEIAWMGTANNASDEWIELRNISGSEVNLSGWQLIDKDGQIKIVFEGGDRIPAGSFYLLERTDDDSVPNIPADKIYAGALGNSDEGLRFFDNNCALIDEALASPAWPAGDNEAKKTMERKGDLSWQASADSGGTPKRPNSSPSAASSPSGGNGGGLPPATADNGQPAKILISEIQITGGSGKTHYDFIELWNPNDFAVNLSGYRLVKRTKNGTVDSGIKSFTGDAFVPAGGFYLWVNSNYADLAAVADATTLATIAGDNGVALRFGAADTGTVIDGVAWGEAQNAFIEGTAFPKNPPANQSIQRKLSDGLFTDTDNNADDLELQTCPSPKAKTCQAVSNQSNQALVAFFDYTPANPRAGEEITLNAASSTGQIVSYLWDFGNGQTASSSEAIFSHIYPSAGRYEISLSVFDAANASSTATSTLSVSERVQILISEIKAGSAGDPNNEYAELYNPNSFAVNLSGWSLKRKPDAAATSTINLVSSFPSSVIPAKGFFLITHDNYRGETSPDVRYSNNSAPLAYRDEGIVLINERGEIIDEAGYREITAGQSLERKALAGSTAESMIGEDRFAGNGYDSGAETDFVSRETPEPQNASGLPEPRPAPSVPAGFSVRYSSSTAEIIFSWTPLAGSFVYRLNEISASSSIIVAETAASEAAIPVSAYGRDFLFSLRAFDGEGLGSGEATTSISVPLFVIFSQTADDAYSVGSYSSDG